MTAEQMLLEDILSTVDDEEQILDESSERLQSIAEEEKSIVRENEEKKLAITAKRRELLDSPLALTAYGQAQARSKTSLESVGVMKST